MTPEERAAIETAHELALRERRTIDAVTLAQTICDYDQQALWRWKKIIQGDIEHLIGKEVGRNVADLAMYYASAEAEVSRLKDTLNASEALSKRRHEALRALAVVKASWDGDGVPQSHWWCSACKTRGEDVPYGDSLSMKPERHAPNCLAAPDPTPPSDAP